MVGTATVVRVRARATTPQWFLFGLVAVELRAGHGPAHRGERFVLIVALAWALRDVTFRAGPLDLVVGGLGLVLLLGWGVYWLLADGSVVPEFSELGWT